MTDDEAPLKLIFANGWSAEQLRERLELCPQLFGIPLLPAVCDVQIIHLRPCRIEPDIEDEP